MDDRELYYVREYHQRLIDASKNESQYKTLRPARPSWSDYLLLRFGDSLIAAGQRMKKNSAFAQTAKPSD
ncbi:MAG: hypothetical protein ACWGO1_10970, partial [Anaerolineales bacterium]